MRPVTSVERERCHWLLFSDGNGTLLEFYVSDERLAEEAFNQVLDAHTRLHA